MKTPIETPAVPVWVHSAGPDEAGAGEVGLSANPARTAAVDASVVVPVFNRAEELGRLLDGLSRQSHPHDRFEILVCDDGSEEDVAGVVRSFVGRSGMNVLYYRQANRGPGPARNLGIENATGELILFTDSDCEPGPRWVADYVRLFADPAVGLAGGLVDYRAARHLSGRCANCLMSSSLGGGARDPRCRVRMRYYPRTCNAAVRRDLALRAGGFSAHRHGEDLQFMDEVAALGYEAAFVPTAVVTHHERRSLAEVAREAYRKGAARVRLATERGMHQPIHAAPAVFVTYLVGFLRALLPAPIWLRPALLAPAAAYAALLIGSGIGAAVSLRSVRAGFATPAFAAAMHAGFGVGYLRTGLTVLCGLFRRNRGRGRDRGIVTREASGAD